MRKIQIAGLCLIMMAAALAGSTLVLGQGSDEDMVVPMGTIELNPPESVEPKKSPVEFPHARHFSFQCQTCHHTWTGAEPIVTCTTSGCHDVTDTAPKSTESAAKTSLGIEYYKTAFHNMCIGCHRKLRRRNLKLELSDQTLKEKLPLVGPTGCVGCHPQ